MTIPILRAIHWMPLVSALLGTLFVHAALAATPAPPAPFYENELIFPPRADHNHAAGIVECPNGDLLVSWYRGTGERTADDVAVYGARRRLGQTAWSDAFVMADTPGFPDCNTTMFVDSTGRLWLFWPIVIANSWESCITHYRVSKNYVGEGSPIWDWQAPILLKPKDFEPVMLDAIDKRVKQTANTAADTPASRARTERYRKAVADKLLTRLGWQPRCKPTALPSGRILLPLYSDTYSAGLMAISDDHGATWFASQPLVGFGNIQPTVLRRNDATLVAYMRENGPLKHIRVSESKDDGITWGPVGVIDLPNPGAGIDAVRLDDGRWLLVYNDTARGRNTLAVSISPDEGKTWKWTRHLERADKGSFHYPAVIQARDHRVHVVYSYSPEAPQSIKHAAFDVDWVLQGDAQ
ncbi:MAG TPA: sialidase family protein [Tepidisphaeraceae bacterium]